MQLSISAYYGLFRIILMARNFFPLCFCVLCWQKRGINFFFCFSPPPPPQEPVSFHILTVCRLAIYFLNSDEEYRSVFLTVFIFLLLLHFRPDRHI